MDSDIVRCKLFGVNTSITESLEKSINAKFFDLSKNYIFNYENVRFVKKFLENCAYLESVTSIGDNISDEWFTTAAVFEITKLFPVAAQITDSDGQFMLIEAAESLPEETTPDNSSNRLFVVDGELRFISSDFLGKTSKKKLGIGEALKIVFETPKDLISVTSEFFEPIQRRINSFDDVLRKEIKNSQTHNFSVKAPEKVLRLLKILPSLVSVAAKAYCFRNPIDNNELRKMAHFRPENFAFHKIRTSRFVYAQLRSAKHFHSRQFLDASFYENREMSLSEEIGAKITFGLEILMSEGNRHLKKDGDINFDDCSQIVSNFECEFEDFRKHLEQIKNQKCSAKIAKKIFVLKILAENAKFGRKHYKHLKFSSQLIYSKLLQKVLKHFPPQTFPKNLNELQPNDSDEWMEVDPNDLNLFFMESASFENEKIGDLKNLNFAEDVQKFINADSGYKGIDFQNLYFEDDLSFDEEDCFHEERIFKGDKFLNPNGVFRAINNRDSNNKFDEENSFKAISKETDAEFLAKSKENMADINIDENLVRNFVTSIEKEEGGSGPASNLLSQLRDTK